MEGLRRVCDNKPQKEHGGKKTKEETVLSV